MDIIRKCPCCKGIGALKYQTKRNLAGTYSFREYYVECHECGLRTSMELTIESAISKWNKREGA